MQTKLTLRIDDRLIRRAKEQARARGISLSSLVASYLSALSSEEAVDASPTVERLRGVLKDPDSSRERYREHLLEKHMN